MNDTTNRSEQLALEFLSRVWGPQHDLDAIDELMTENTRTLVDSKFWGQYFAVKYGTRQIAKAGSITLFSGTVSQKPIPGTSAYAAVGSAIDRTVVGESGYWVVVAVTLRSERSNVAYGSRLCENSTTDFLTVSTEVSFSIFRRKKKTKAFSHSFLRAFDMVGNVPLSFHTAWVAKRHSALPGH